MSPEQLLKALDSIVNDGDFASKVREFHSYRCSNGKCDDESVDEANRYITRFKKYKERLMANPSEKSKPYRELKDFYTFLKNEEVIQPMPSPFALPENIAKVMNHISKEIWEEND